MEVGEKCWQLPRASSSESRSVRCMEKARVGVMVMQEANGNIVLDSVGLRSWLPSRSFDHCARTKAVTPVLPNKQSNNFDAVHLKVKTVKTIVVA